MGGGTSMPRGRREGERREARESAELATDAALHARLRFGFCHEGSGSPSGL